MTSRENTFSFSLSPSEEGKQTTKNEVALRFEEEEKGRLGGRGPSPFGGRRARPGHDHRAAATRARREAPRASFRRGALQKQKVFLRWWKKIDQFLSHLDYLFRKSHLGGTPRQHRVRDQKEISESRSQGRKRCGWTETINWSRNRRGNALAWCRLGPSTRPQGRRFLFSFELMLLSSSTYSILA